MGRVVTPKYRLELVVPGFNFTAFAWSGLPSPARLAAHVRQLNQSFDLGGVNHLPGSPRVARAVLVRQSDQRTVAVYERDRGAWKVHGQSQFVAEGA
jgi:hypothetical protein